jgi:hypothetical protein
MDPIYSYYQPLDVLSVVSCVEILYCEYYERFFRAWLRFTRAFSSVVRQMSGYNSQRQDTDALFPIRR